MIFYENRFGRFLTRTEMEEAELEHYDDEDES